MDEVETRELRYFVAVAEELHFGRAARRLGIAQPPLSRAIRQLERRMGVTLIERTSRSAQLTPAGEVLLREGRGALEAVAAATRRAQRAGCPGGAGPRLILAVKPGGDGGMLPDILAAYGAQPEATGVDIAFSAAERAAMLRDGRADVALLRRPQDDLSGVDAEDLLTEKHVVVLPGGHHLARQATVRLADLAGEPMPRWPGMPESGGAGPLVSDIGQLMQLITLGRAVAVLPESARGGLQPGLACRPVADAPATTLVVAWHPASTSPHVAAFVRAAAAAARTRTAALG